MVLQSVRSKRVERPNSQGYPSRLSVRSLAASKIPSVSKFANPGTRILYVGRSPLPGACNFHTVPVKRRFHK